MFCRTERSTDQVVKPVNLEALSKWVGAVPQDVRNDMKSIAPMLERLGYDPEAYPPNYGDPDKGVLDNTLHVRNNDDYWKRKGQEVLTVDKVAKRLPQGPQGPLAPQGPANGGAADPQGHINTKDKETYGKDFDEAKQVLDKDQDKSDNQNVAAAAANNAGAR